MKLSDFDYELPEHLIAQHPAKERDASRLMVLDRSNETIHHTCFRDLPAFLRNSDCLVVNETRVFPARLRGHKKDTGGAIEMLLVRRVSDRAWEALVKPGRRLRVGAEISFAGSQLDAVVEAVSTSGSRMVRFSGEGSIEELIESQGELPLPPYIRRGNEPGDRERYQTVYGKRSGAIAAPTAGLHFTQALLDRIEADGVSRVPVLLHVGLGTFKPVEAETIDDHQMDEEYFEVSDKSAQRINACRNSDGRIVAVGTTSVRTLESLGTSDRHVVAGSGWTDLFIRPPYDFKVVDVLITNFHLPRSTLLVLVSAFAGHEFLVRAYDEAVREAYRFYSYGDCMLIV